MKRAGLIAVSLFLLAMCGGGGGGRDLAYSGNVPAGVRPVCGNDAILGETLPRITAPGGCGVSRPVRLFAVSGVRLNSRPILNCAAARSLRTWIAKGARPAVEDIGEELTRIRVVAHYACRNRNNAQNGRISEHAKGNAIDIAGFGLSNGEYISVEDDWGRGAKGRALKDMRQAACGPFGVVLGPGSDRFHSDHFHFDISNLRRPYCR